MKINYKLNTKIRIDIFLANQLNTTRSFIATLIKEKRIFLNDILVLKPGTFLKLNDQITINSKEDSDFNNLNNNLKIEFSIVYEDEYLMIINKPKGLICHESSFHEENTLVKQIALYYKTKNYKFNDLKDMRYGLVHRLDKKTSGLLIVAKNRDVFNEIKKNLENKKIKKYYYTLVLNPFKEKNISFVIDLPINHNKTSTKMVVNNDGKPAQTLVKVLENFNNYALVECDLLTGRTHQIRVHLSAINHPIYNDELYGTKINDDGQYLFAHRIELIHPITKEEMVFEIGKDELLIKKIKEIVS